MSQTARRQITFRPTDFLLEAVEEFLESGAKEKKIGSSVIKIAVATELLLKQKLENMCPALVLEKIDDDALQVAKLYGLGSKMLNPKELEKVHIRTASFPNLLRRASRFFDLSKARRHLEELQDIRNELVHHRGRVDMANVNLLLIEKIFPFLEEFTEGDPQLLIRLKSGMWKRLRQVAQSSADAIVTETSKKIAHFATLAERLSSKTMQSRLKSSPEVEGGEDIKAGDLKCPSCGKVSVTVFVEWDMDFDEDGHPMGGGMFLVLRCRVCGLELGHGEVEQIIRHFEKFFGEADGDEKEKWEEALAEPDYSDFYP